MMLPGRTDSLTNTRLTDRPNEAHPKGCCCYLVVRNPWKAPTQMHIVLSIFALPFYLVFAVVLPWKILVFFGDLTIARRSVR